jgi:2-keto-4-pentenoate hydratase
MNRDMAAQLLASRAEGDYCPGWLVGSLDLAQALDLQLAVLQGHLDAGASIGGWKVGLTSEASRTKLGADERPFGFVLADRTLASGASIDSSTIHSLSVETEMCFTIGSDIDNPSIGPDAVLDHVSQVGAGFELNEARPGSARPDFCAMVTDCLTNWGIVSGPGIPPTSAAALSSTRITMERNGAQVFDGVSSDHVDDHTISLCRLVEQLARHGQMLRAGQKVITGAFARFPAAPGDHWRADFHGIGSVEIDVV